MSGRILVVDDDRSLCELLAAGLARRGFSVEWTTSGDDAFARAKTGDFDVVVADINMKGLSGTELCERIVANRPDLPVIVITAFGSLDTAVASIRAGAYDFITKPFETDALALALQRAVQHRALREEVRRLRDVVAETKHFGELIGASPAMQEVQHLLAKVAPTDAAVVITGESGTGKEVVARALHAKGQRPSGPFVAVNCAAIPQNLLESELFGHTRGAFTDARVARVGLFQQADGGTLFLDEIGDVPLSLQPKLLRALQERRVRPVGADQEVPFDARVISATNRDLEEAVEEKRFREDLYYRINVIRVALPPLRARAADVLLLAQHFLARNAARMGKAVAGISPAAAAKLLSYAWPGNVRELQNCIERAVALTQFERIAVEDLPETIRNYTRSHVIVASDDPEELVSMEEVERRYVLRVLEATGGNKKAAAQILGFDRRTLYRKLERYGVPTARDD
ncbi:MAG: sigma-54-dependent Fis family transcriptional regulator [Deltaproteobacteria bacterium]|nr:sigma-54-dependent Fis family transcriptional regulator [Deltaproteobacteria bacterium]